jgi:Domain of unknown function (DUF4166)
MDHVPASGFPLQTTVAAGLFPSLLGETFNRLDAPVRAVHGGRSRRLRGTATVARGQSFLARLLCTIASLPRSSDRMALEVQITAEGHTEQWTRYFGDSRPMDSRLLGKRGLLTERIGPAVLVFRLGQREGGIEWSFVKIFALGIALPKRWFSVAAFSGARADRYTFSVEVALIGVGRVIRYDGELDVSGAS